MHHCTCEAASLSSASRSHPEEDGTVALETRRLHPVLGVEIIGVDVRRIEDARFREIVDAFDEHSVLLFRRQQISDQEQIDFSRRFGPLETTIRTIASQARDLPEISNLA